MKSPVTFSLTDTQSQIAGVWIGAVIAIPLLRYVTIPPMPWGLTLKLECLIATVCSLVFYGLSKL